MDAKLSNDNNHVPTTMLELRTFPITERVGNKFFYTWYIYSQYVLRKISFSSYLAFTIDNEKYCVTDER